MAKALISVIGNILFRKKLDIDERKEPDVQHIAIDQCGTLRSFYDECQDTITGKLDVDLQSHTFKTNEPIICRLHKGCTPESENLLKMVDIDHSLRVSIILKIIQPTNIALIIDYPQAIDQYTRFLYFCHETCIKFARFLLTTKAREDDPFLSGLIRMIKEEESICQQQNESNFNEQLAIELKAFRNDYEQSFDEIDLGPEKEILSDMYELITSVNEIPMMKEQVDAIRKYHHHLLTFNEHDVCEQITRF